MKHIFSLLATLFLISGCGGGDGPAILQSVSILPAAPYTGVGLTEPLSAVGSFSDGTTRNITGAVSWRSDATTVAKVDATGLVTGISLGTTTISAAADRVTASVLFTVTGNPWSPAGAMNVARSGHTATLLPNGEVLVAGGATNSGSGPITASVELYDPSTNSWAVQTSMSTPREFHTATLLPSGKVLVVAGSGPSFAELASAELYDPATGTWSAASNLSVARLYHSATLLPNGKVLVAGGSNVLSGGTGTVVGAEQLYDPGTNTWSTAASMLTPRALHTATLLNNGKVLVAGGYGSAYFVNAELYDPMTNSWAVTGSMTSPRSLHTATLLPDGRVLVAGGRGSTTLYVANAEVFTPVGNNWASAGSMTSAREAPTATLFSSGNVLIAGGYSGSFYPSTADLYDSATNTWFGPISLTTARRFHTATLLNNGKVLLVGGENGGTILSSAELSWRW
jgi:N-acetylneuraminic acid mutarotase